MGEDEKKVVKNLEKEVAVTTVTSVTSTTTVTLHPGGNTQRDLTIEPIGIGNYLFKLGEKKGIAISQYDKETMKYFLEIEGNRYNFRDRPIKIPFFRIPNNESINDWITGKYKIKEINEIFQDLVEFYRTTFDLLNPNNSIILALRDIISWLRDTLTAFFFMGIDATRGAGKTSLLYAMSLLSKHGSMSGDISTSFLARAIDKQKLCLFVDELDQLPKERKGEIESILRKAQRRGNPFNRVNPNTLEPESFEVHGPHSFSFRSDIEEALKHRCLSNRLKVSSDPALPVINYHIQFITEPIFNDLFFFFFENAQKFQSYAGGQVTLVTPILATLKGKSTPERRKKLFEFFTKEFKLEEIELMKSLIGRNIELCYICLQVTHLLGLKIFDSIKQALEVKQSEEEIPESFYFERLKEYLWDVYLDNKNDWTLVRGEHEGSFYFPKNKAFAGFTGLLKGQSIPTIGTSRFNGLLKDIGFLEGINWKNQKDLQNRSVKCLIYDKDIVKQIKAERKEPDEAEMTKFVLAKYNENPEEWNALHVKGEFAKRFSVEEPFWEICKKEGIPTG